jgi:hypothetical protein
MCYYIEQNTKMSAHIIVLNLTTESYYIGDNTIECAAILRSLIKPLTKEEAILKSDVGESHWRRDDKIVYVPKHLYNYVQKNYNKLFV